MVADDISEFFSRKLKPRRIAADERRWAISLWLLALMAALAWTAILTTGMMLKRLVF